MKRRWKRRQQVLQQKRKEWVGGRFVLPVTVTGEGAAYSPAATVWLELPDGIIVQNETYDPREGEASLVDALLDAVAEPIVGPPRRPNRVRVASSDDAVELREHFGPALEVVVAPTPEIDELARSFAEHMRRESSPGSWLDELLPRDAPELPRFFRAVADSVGQRPARRLGTKCREPSHEQFVVMQA